MVCWMRLCVILLCLQGSILHAGGVVLPRSSKKHSQPLSGFDTIICGGSVRLHLDGKHAGVVKKNHDHVFTKVERGVLLLDGEKRKGYKTDVVLGRDALRRLKTLKVADSCQVEGDALKMPFFALYSHTKGSIRLRGEFGTYKLFQEGSNHVDMYWLHARDMDIDVHDGRLQLAGIGQRVRVKLSGKSRVDLRYLRSKKMWLLATDKSRVDVFGGKRLISYARGSAKIISHGIPREVSDMSHDKGVLLYKK